MASKKSEKRLPRVSLKGLRSFESAARHRSSVGASRELGVTLAAVSWNVNRLETQLGVLLFSRDPPHIDMTKAGLQLARALRKAFDIIERGLRKVPTRRRRPSNAKRARRTDVVA
jgi:DNA-binding transcriptional LysR family regulator